MTEKFFEDIGHPIPTRAHIKGKACGFKFPCSAASGCIFFEDCNVESILRKKARGRQAGKSGTNNGYSCHPAKLDRNTISIPATAFGFPFSRGKFYSLLCRLEFEGDRQFHDTCIQWYAS